jgi:predicted unusual protein kinase regulating ubiquinone biosynthesis (AarF/ABC1/UbiB family)
MELVKDYHRLDRLLDELTPQQLLDFATMRLEGLSPEIPLQLIWSQIALQLEGLTRWGISHGDVHLGNLYALEPERDGDGWKIFLCDFGMMNDQSEKERLFAVHAGCSLTYYWDGRVMGRLFPSFEGNEGKTAAIEKFTDHLYHILGKYFVEPKEGSEMVWYPIIQRGTSTNIVSEIMYAAATMGLTVPHTCWLLFKNMNYIANLGVSMWTSINLTNVWGPHCKKYVKDVVLHDLDTKNITNLRDSLPDLLTNLRPYDRNQILGALPNGDKVKPMESCWALDGSSPSHQDAAPTASAPQGGAG